MQVADSGDVLSRNRVCRPRLEDIKIRRVGGPGKRDGQGWARVQDMRREFDKGMGIGQECRYLDGHPGPPAAVDFPGDAVFEVGCDIDAADHLIHYPLVWRAPFEFGGGGGGLGFVNLD